MVRVMGQQRAYFFIRRMAELHNARSIDEYITGLDGRDGHDLELGRLCAAYGVVREAGESSDLVKGRLIKVLHDGARPYDAAAIARYDAKHPQPSSARRALEEGEPPRKAPKTA